MINPHDLPALDVLAKTIYGEARGEPYLGMQAVACVVLNRVKLNGWMGHDIKSVCLKLKQFSCWNDDDVNLPLILAANVNNSLYGKCLALANEAIDGKLADVTGGSDSYCVRNLVTSWNKNLTPVARIGMHDFYITVNTHHSKDAQAQI